MMRIGREIQCLPYAGTSLLCRLQVQTLLDATPPIAKIHPFSKTTVNFEPMMQFRFLLRFLMSKTCATYFSLNRATGPIQSLSCNIRVYVCLSILESAGDLETLLFYVF